MIYKLIENSQRDSNCLSLFPRLYVEFKSCKRKQMLSNYFISVLYKVLDRFSSLFRFRKSSATAELQKSFYHFKCFRITLNESVIYLLILMKQRSKLLHLKRPVLFLDDRTKLFLI